MIKRNQYFEDYVIGETRETFGRTVTESDVVMHAGQTGDFFPHHMDSEWVKNQPFGRRVAHGTLILSIGIGMTAVEINELAFSYGYNKIRFIKPVFIGDTIHVLATNKEKYLHPSKKEYGFLVENIEVFNQKLEIVLACEHLYLVKKMAI